MTKLKAGSFLALPLIGLLCISLCISAAADMHQQAELDKLKRSISTLEEKLQNQRQEKDQLQTQLELIEIDVAKLNQNIHSFRYKIAAAKKKLSTLQSKKSDLQQRIAKQRSAIAEHIRSAYKTGSEEPIKLLLNQQDPQQLTRILKYYDYLLEARTNKIQQFTADIDQLKKTVADIQTTKLALSQSKKALEADRKKLASNVKKRKTTLGKVEKSLLSSNKKLTDYQKQRKQLETVINTVKKAAARIAPAKDYPSFASSKGKLSWPVKGKLTHSFGSRRGNYLRWDGWLINARSGADIKAIHHGRVVFSNYLRGFGLLLIVDHGDGFMSLYAHNQALLRETGDWVQSDEVISRAGNTGGLTDPALYFEIREQGTPVNPKIWLSKP